MAIELPMPSTGCELITQETLTAGGQIMAIYPSTRLVTLELAITDEAGQVTTPGQAVVQLRG